MYNPNIRVGKSLFCSFAHLLFAQNSSFLRVTRAIRSQTLACKMSNFEQKSEERMNEKANSQPWYVSDLRFAIRSWYEQIVPVALFSFFFFKERLQRFAPVPLNKRATVSDLLRSFMTKEQRERFVLFHEPIVLSLTKAIKIYCWCHIHVVIDYVDKISPYSQQLCYPRICAVNYYVITLSAYIVNYTMLSPYLHSQQLLYPCPSSRWLCEHYVHISKWHSSFATVLKVIFSCFPYFLLN